MSYELKRLQAKHQQILELKLAGYPHTAIASEVGVSPQNVSDIVRSPLFQGQLSERQKSIAAKNDEAHSVKILTAKETLNAAAVHAAETQIALLESSCENIQQRSAMDILDRTGTPKFTKSENLDIQAKIILDASAIERIQRAQKEAFGTKAEFPLTEVQNNE